MGSRSGSAHARLAMMIDDRRQVAGRDPGSVAHGDRPANGRLELAYVARPIVPLEDIERIAGESRDGFVKLLRISGPE